MQAIICESKNEWDSFILENENVFLQAFSWGELQEKFGKKVFRIKVYQEKEIFAEAQVVKEKLLFKNYFYIPYGPIFKKNIALDQKNNAEKCLFEEVIKLAKIENCIFLRVEPISELNLQGIKTKAPLKRFQPQTTLFLDLTKSEDELLADLGSTTRRNVILAKKNNVAIEKQSKDEDRFFELLNKTKERQEFGIHDKKHYEKILNIKDNYFKAELFLAKQNKNVINGTLVLFFGDTATTLHSGSDYNFRQLKGANLLRWEIILEAKNRGFKKIDFWGIDEKKWPGLTAFKMGFGGQKKEYSAGFDLVFSKIWYNAYKIIKLIKS